MIEGLGELLAWNGAGLLSAGLTVMMFGLAVVLVVQAVINGIGPVPTSRAVRVRIRPLLPDSIGGDILELGAGWGGVAMCLARMYRNNKVVAIENSWPVWLFCWIRARLLGPDNLTVVRADLYDVRLDKAGLVYCYLFPDAMRKLRTNLTQAPPGSLLLSHTFSVPGMQPVQEVTASDLWRSPLYLYRLGAVDGSADASGGAV